MKKKFFICIFCILLIVIAMLFITGFSDVHQEDWYYDNVTDMAQNGYLNGYEDHSFKPDGTITNAEFVSIIARINNLAGKDSSFSHWAAGAMQAALEASYYDWDEIPPTGETFDKPIPRQLAVKIVMKAFLPNETGNYNTVSNNVSDFSQLDGRYYDSMIAAYSNGIVYGDDNSCLNPRASLTRAEACAVIMRAVNKTEHRLPYNPPSSTDTPTPVTARSGGVSENGSLSVNGTQLVNKNGDPIVLHGMSSHGLQWFPSFATEQAIKATSDYGANLFRCAMYTGEGGYLSNRDIKTTLINAVDSAIRQDMYVIIDWHILSDGDPLLHMDEAVAFFTEMSERYRDSPAVLYEICNEPNGNISWEHNVKPYAERIIAAIRQNSNGIILVGSPTWSQDLHEAAKMPVEAENIMYTCHFYAGTHTDWLRQRIIESNLPVFISEWGTSSADGSGGVYLEEARKWIDFMNENKISWANWSLCDKNESSAALISGADLHDGISEDELTESGRFVFQNFSKN